MKDGDKIVRDYNMRRLELAAQEAGKLRRMYLARIYNAKNSI